MNILHTLHLQAMQSFALRTGATWAMTLCLAGFSAISMPALAEVQAQKTSNLQPEEIFRHSCAVCHGERGNGNGRASINLDPKPRDFTQSSNLTREAMINAITYGRPGTAMMSWTKKYNEKQIAAVADYIRGRFMLVALEPRIEAGRGVYGHFCQICHGDRGQGVTTPGTPRDWTVPKNQASLTRERMIKTVAQGKHGDTVSAGFADKLSAENIGASVDYIRRVLLPTLAERDKDAATAQPNPGVTQVVPPPPETPAPKAPATTPAPAPPAPAAAAPAKPVVTQADMSLPLPKGLKGDIKQGEKFFMGNCATCHGKLGNGEGPRAYFLNPRPRNFHDEYSHTNLNRPSLFSVINTGKPGTVMPAWGKVLSDQEIANVAEFVFDTFVQEKAKAK
jgi:mono/diheme cytochrome c family protein